MWKDFRDIKKLQRDVFFLVLWEKFYIVFYSFNLFNIRGFYLIILCENFVLFILQQCGNVIIGDIF